AAADRGVLPRRVVRAVRAVPRRHRAPGGGAAPARSRSRAGERARDARRARAGDARRVDLRPRPDRGERCGLGDLESGSLRAMTQTTLLAAPKRVIELTVDGEPVRVLDGSTILDACRMLGIDTPTLCFGDTLTPVNVCRVCVVELEGSRTLVPACSRKAE